MNTSILMGAVGWTSALLLNDGHYTIGMLGNGLRPARYMVTKKEAGCWLHQK